MEMSSVDGAADGSNGNHDGSSCMVDDPTYGSFFDHMAALRHLGYASQQPAYTPQQPTYSMQQQPASANVPPSEAEAPQSHRLPNALPPSNIPSPSYSNASQTSAQRDQDTYEAQHTFIEGSGGGPSLAPSGAPASSAQPPIVQPSFSAVSPQAPLSLVSSSSTDVASSSPPPPDMSTVLHPVILVPASIKQHQQWQLKRWQQQQWQQRELLQAQLQLHKLLGQVATAPPVVHDQSSGAGATISTVQQQQWQQQQWQQQLLQHQQLQLLQLQQLHTILGQGAVAPPARNQSLSASAAQPPHALPDGLVFFPPTTDTSPGLASIGQYEGGAQIVSPSGASSDILSDESGIGDHGTHFEGDYDTESEMSLADELRLAREANANRNRSKKRQKGKPEQRNGDEGALDEYEDSGGNDDYYDDNYYDSSSSRKKPQALSSMATADMTDAYEDEDEDDFGNVTDAYEDEDEDEDDFGSMTDFDEDEGECDNMTDFDEDEDEDGNFREEPTNAENEEAMQRYIASLQRQLERIGRLPKAATVRSEERDDNEENVGPMNQETSSSCSLGEMVPCDCPECRAQRQDSEKPTPPATFAHLFREVSTWKKFGVRSDNTLDNANAVVDLCRDFLKRITEGASAVEARAIEVTVQSIAQIANSGKQQHTCCACTLDPTFSWSNENSIFFTWILKGQMRFKVDQDRTCEKAECVSRYCISW